jgi:hypothetical protein
MRTRILLALALALVAALVAVQVASGSASGAARKNHAVNATLRMARIGDNGPSGSTFAGEIVGKPTGRAAMVIRNTVTGSSSVGKAIEYAKRGTIIATLKNEIQPQPDGSVKIPGTFKVIGGTGRYRGATGGGSFDGTLPANGTVFEVKLNGKIRY